VTWRIRYSLELPTSPVRPSAVSAGAQCESVALAVRGVAAEQNAGVYGFDRVSVGGRSIVRSAHGSTRWLNARGRAIAEGDDI
jgi:hypothetical protein